MALSQGKGVELGLMDSILFFAYWEALLSLSPASQYAKPCPDPGMKPSLHSQR